MSAEIIHLDEYRRPPQKARPPQEKVATVTNIATTGKRAWSLLSKAVDQLIKGEVGVRYTYLNSVEQVRHVGSSDDGSLVIIETSPPEDGKKHNDLKVLHIFSPRDKQGRVIKTTILGGLSVPIVSEHIRFGDVTHREILTNPAVDLASTRYTEHTSGFSAPLTPEHFLDTSTTDTLSRFTNILRESVIITAACAPNEDRSRRS